MCDDNGDSDERCVDVNPPEWERVKKHEKMPNGPFSPKYALSPLSQICPRGAPPPPQYYMPPNDATMQIYATTLFYERKYSNAEFNLASVIIVPVLFHPVQCLGSTVNVPLVSSTTPAVKCSYYAYYSYYYNSYYHYYNDYSYYSDYYNCTSATTPTAPTTPASSTTTTSIERERAATPNPQYSTSPAHSALPTSRFVKLSLFQQKPLQSRFPNCYCFKHCSRP